MFREDDYGVTAEDVMEAERVAERVETLPYEDMLAIALCFRRREWPSGLEGKPKDWDVMHWRKKYMWVQTIVRSIELKIGGKAVDRHYFTTVKGFTDRQFEDLWDSHSRYLSEEEHKELNESYYRSNKSDQNRDNRGFLIESILFFALGLLVAFFLL